MNTSSHSREPTTRKWAVGRALVVGALIGGPCWAASGMLVAVLVMVLISSVLRLLSPNGYVPFTTSLQHDTWVLARVFAGLAILPGLIGGATMGLVVSGTGLPQEPRFWTLVRYCGGLFGVCVTNLGHALCLLRGRFTEDSGLGPLNQAFFNVNKGALSLASVEVGTGYTFWQAWLTTGPARFANLGIGVILLLVFVPTAKSWYRRALRHYSEGL
jgi:hypothetical protein